MWFEGLAKGRELLFEDSSGKPHIMRIVSLPQPDESGRATIRYILDSEVFSQQVQVCAGTLQETSSVEMADPANELHVAAPSNGDLWVVHVAPGDRVKEGEEICNISIMKQEKAVFAPMDGVVKRVLKSADFQRDKKMVPVIEGELLVELGPLDRLCPGCSEPVSSDDHKFCPKCGKKI